MTEEYIYAFTIGFNDSKPDFKRLLASSILFVENFQGNGYYLFIQVDGQGYSINGWFGETKLVFDSVHESNYLYKAEVPIDSIDKETEYKIEISNERKAIKKVVADRVKVEF